MITIKRILLILGLVLMWLPVSMKAQTPTMTFDGNKLTVVVPTGHLEFQKNEMSNAAIRDCFDWAGRESCIFMSSTDPYILYPQGLSTDDKVSVSGLFEGNPITIDVEMKPGQDKVKPTKDPSSKMLSSPTLMYILGAVVLLLLLIILTMLLRRKKSKPSQEPVQEGPQVLDMITDESVVFDKGLDHVKMHPEEYQVFDMDSVFADTAVNKVYLSNALVKKLYDFFNNSLEGGGRTNETGCFILGCWDHQEGNPKRYDLSLEYMVEPGDDADFGEYSLNFGKKIGINTASIINTLGTKSKRDYVLTCWMHSHPGLGLFLSNQDLIVQQQLAYPEHRNRLIAIVIDTNTPDFKVGFFTAKHDGKMNNQEEVKRWFSFEEIYRQSREMNRNGNTSNDLLAEFKANPEYFNMELNDESMSHLGFAAHAINQIDNVLFSNVKGVIGYLFGENVNGYMQVGCCLPYENDEKVGCIINDVELSAATLGKYASELDGCKLFINSNADDQLQIWTRNSSGSFTQTGATTLSQMKEWIRRKRI